MRSRPAIEITGPTSFSTAAAMARRRFIAIAMVMMPPMEVPMKTARAMPACVEERQHVRGVDRRVVAPRIRVALRAAAAAHVDRDDAPALRRDPGRDVLEVGRSCA